MKKLSKIAALLAASALLFGGLFMSCSDDDDDDDDEPKHPTSVVVGGTLASVKKGDNFSVDGIKVFALYDNKSGTYSDCLSGSYEDLAKKATYTANDSAKTVLKIGEAVNLPAGTYEITVTYDGKASETKLSLTVTEKATTKPGDTNLPEGSIYVGLGTAGDATLNVSKVTVDNEEKTTLVDSAFNLSAGWNDLKNLKTVALASGSSISFTFTQTAHGTGNDSSWELAFYDGELEAKGTKGLVARSDTWIQKYDWTANYFEGGKLFDTREDGEYGNPGNYVYSEGYTFANTGRDLANTDVVILTVAYDGSNVTITEKINDVQAMTVSSTAWKAEGGSSSESKKIAGILSYDGSTETEVAPAQNDGGNAFSNVSTKFTATIPYNGYTLTEGYPKHGKMNYTWTSTSAKADSYGMMVASNFKDGSTKEKVAIDTDLASLSYTFILTGEASVAVNVAAWNTQSGHVYGRADILDSSDTVKATGKGTSGTKEDCGAKIEATTLPAGTYTLKFTWVNGKDNTEYKAFTGGVASFKISANTAE